MIELGYAAKALGWERIIMVMNESKGTSEMLPVDIRDRRRPITFSLKIDDKERSLKLANLKSDIENALKSIKDQQLQSAKDAFRMLDGPSLLVIEHYLKNKNADYPTPQHDLQNIPKDKLDFNTFALGCSRLLDLGLIRTSIQTYNKTYKYYLTLKGWHVCEYLKDYLKCVNNNKS